MKKYLLLLSLIFLSRISIAYAGSKLDTSDIDGITNENSEVDNNITNDMFIENINPLAIYITNTNYVVVKSYGSAKMDWLGEKNVSNKSVVNAQKNAVAIAVNNIINTGVVLEDFNIKKSKLIRDYKMYVKEYVLLSSERITNKIETEIEAAVEYTLIKDYILSNGFLNDENTKASISVVVIDNNENAENIFSSEVVARLDESGFYPVENNYDILNNYFFSGGISYSNTTERKSLESITRFVSNENKSKYAIVGSVEASFLAQIEGTSLITFRSVLNLNIIDIQNSKIITNILYQTSASSGGYESAYDFVIKKTAKYASDEIINILNKYIDSGREPTDYNLIISDLSYEDSLLFQKEIKNNIELIKNVYNYGEQEGRQHLVVSFLGDIKTLAIELNIKARNIGFRIIIDSYDDTTINLSAKKR